MTNVEYDNLIDRLQKMKDKTDLDERAFNDKLNPSSKVTTFLTRSNSQNIMVLQDNKSMVKLPVTGWPQRSKFPSLGGINMGPLAGTILAAVMSGVIAVIGNKTIEWFQTKGAKPQTASRFRTNKKIYGALMAQFSWNESQLCDFISAVRYISRMPASELADPCMEHCFPEVAAFATDVDIAVTASKHDAETEYDEYILALATDDQEKSLVKGQEDTTGEDDDDDDAIINPKRDDNEISGNEDNDDSVIPSTGKSTTTNFKNTRAAGVLAVLKHFYKEKFTLERAMETAKGWGFKASDVPNLSGKYVSGKVKFLAGFSYPKNGDALFKQWQSGNLKVTWESSAQSINYDEEVGSERSAQPSSPSRFLAAPAASVKSAAKSVEDLFRF